MTALEGAAGDVLIAFKETGDASLRWAAHADGTQHWSTPGDVHAGGSFGWDDNNYGWVLRGQPGSADTELYIIDPDNAANFINLYMGPLISFHSADFGSAQIGLTDTADTLTVTASGGLKLSNGIILTSPNGVSTKLVRLADGGAALELVDP